MKNLLPNLQKDHLDEVVFAHRNKAYGAYDLRNDYSNQLTKALFIGITFFASLSVVPLLMNAFKSDVALPKDDFSGRKILVINDTKIPESTPVKTTPASVKTVANPEVTPVREVRKEVTLPTKKQIEDAAVGSQTVEGPATTLAVAPPINVGPPATVNHPPVTPPAPLDDPNAIIDGTKADVAADFKGGINAFREKVAQNFDTSSVEQAGMVSATITFVVEKDGSISNIKINGSNAEFNREAERTVKSIKTKWTPAQLKGKAVRSSFRMPISMKIE